MATKQQKLKKKLQVVFNSYIRKRDEGKPCISCGIKKNPLDAGHFFAVKGYDGLRYDEDNVHGECPGCNRFDESHLIMYQKNLQKRIGKSRFDKLMKRSQDYKRNGYKFSVPELEELIDYYKNKLK